jgi:hypothetical protein
LNEREAPQRGIARQRKEPDAARELQQKGAIQPSGFQTVRAIPRRTPAAWRMNWRLHVPPTTFYTCARAQRSGPAVCGNWKAILKGAPGAARCVLQTLIDGRLTFTPKANEEGEFYEIMGLAALPQIVNGKTLVNLASPTGVAYFSVMRGRVLRRAA